jgi:hypothetical protein
MGFAKNLVPLVLSGAKTLTYRLGNKYAFLEIGDEINVKNSSTDKIFGRVKIIEKDWTTFKDLPIDRKGHEAYKSKAKQRQTFEQYYGKINDKDKMLVLRFRLIK